MIRILQNWRAKVILGAQAIKRTHRIHTKSVGNTLVTTGVCEYTVHRFYITLERSCIFFELHHTDSKKKYYRLSKIICNKSLSISNSKNNRRFTVPSSYKADISEGISFCFPERAFVAVYKLNFLETNSTYFKFVCISNPSASPIIEFRIVTGICCLLVAKALRAEYHQLNGIAIPWNPKWVF